MARRRPSSPWLAGLLVVSAVAWGAAPASTQGGDRCDGGEIHDDGAADIGLMSSTPTVLVDRFTPLAYPHVYERICVCLFDQIGVQDNDLELRIYDDDGPDGEPGTLLYAGALTAEKVPTFPGRFYAFDLDQPPTVTEGSVYIGLAWLEQFLVCIDTSPGTPEHPSYLGTTSGGPWQRTTTPFPFWRATMIRAVGSGPVPAMPAAGLLLLAMLLGMALLAALRSH